MSKYNAKDFGKNIRIARKRKGYTQDKLGILIGKDGSTIGRFELGQTDPTSKDIVNLCDVLDIEPYQLFGKSLRVNNIDKNVNPFKTDTLYLYYYGFNTKN